MGYTISRGLNSMDIIRFKPLRPTGLSEMVEDSIKDLLLTGHLKHGTKLPSEKQISKQFGVSVVTVREALRGLQAFGIIEKRRGKGGGIFVAQPRSDTAKTVMQTFLISKNFSAGDVCQLRTIVEPAAIKIAASNITPDDIKELEDNVLRCEQQLKKAESGVSRKYLPEVREGHLEFHRLIAEATHNPILALTVDYMLDFLTYFSKMVETREIAKIDLAALENHRHILDCLKKRDGEGAAKQMLIHLKSLEDFFEHYFLNNQNNEPHKSSAGSLNHNETRKAV